jgi:hypothetical protein
VERAMRRLDPGVERTDERQSADGSLTR